MVDALSNTGGKLGSAPYTSFQSFKTLIGSLQTNGLPNRIDRSVLMNFSGSVGSQIITALKFLRLINEGGHPTEKFKTLVDTHNSDDWAEELGKTLKEAYAPMFSLDLERASPSQFMERFRSNYTGTDEVLRKSVTFFLNAVRDAKIEVSSYILKNTKPRSASPKRRVKRKAAPERKRNQDQQLADSGGGSNTPKKTSQIVFEAFDPANMPEDVQQATLTLLTYLKSRESQGT